MINNHFLFDRSIRTGYIDLYKYTLPLIANLFFVFNHQNYARYLTLYHCNLENVEQSHPGLNVVVGVKRTNKPFSKREVDFTVESTINWNCMHEKLYICSSKVEQTLCSTNGNDLSRTHRSANEKNEKNFLVI